MSYIFANPEHTLILHEQTGRFIPVHLSNSDYAFLVETGTEILPYARFSDAETARKYWLGELSARRKQAEREFDFGGARVTLDTETQARLSAAIQYLSLSGVPSVEWQIARGVFRPLSLAELQAFGVAAGAHVQACFANAHALAKEIEAADFETLKAFDIERGWK